MSHRIIISSVFKQLFENGDVQAAAAEKLTIQQRDRIASICADPGEPCDEDLRFLTRKLNQIYTTDD